MLVKRNKASERLSKHPVVPGPIDLTRQVSPYLNVPVTPSSTTSLGVGSTVSSLPASSYNSRSTRSILGVEAIVLRQAEFLMYDRTLFFNPFPEPVALSCWIVEVW